MSFGPYSSQDFNQTVESLPNSIRDITFGFYFNQNVDNLPNSILNLTFGYSFNQNVDNLPNSILNLTFGYEFNQPIGKIPSELKILNIDKQNPNIKIISESVLKSNPNIIKIEFDSEFNS